MQEKMSVQSLLKTKQQELSLKLTTAIKHPTSKGDHCEEAWIKYLKSFLPARYGVTKGYVFDSEGNVSLQIDIIIYDTLYSPLIYELESGEKFVTAESVYAIFDSKQEVTKKTIKETDEKIASVKELYRTSREMYSSGKEQPPRDLTRILGGILAKNVNVKDEKFREYMSMYQNIDFGCIIENYAFLNARQGDSLEIQKSNSEETAAAFFYILLDELHKLGTVQAIDIRKYAELSLENFKFDTTKSSI